MSTRPTRIRQRLQISLCLLLRVLGRSNLVKFRARQRYTARLPKDRDFKQPRIDRLRQV